MRIIAAAFLLLLWIVSVAVGQGSVDLIQVDGSYEAGKLWTDEQITFHIKVTNNTGQTIAGIISGFRVWSPDGAIWQPISYVPYQDPLPPNDWYFVTPEWGTLFSQYFTPEFSINGSLADTIGFACVAIPFPPYPPGMADGFSDEVYNISTFLDDSQNGKTLCLDSSWYPPNGSWFWAHDGGDVYPSWSGPHCWQIFDDPNEKPVINNCPTLISESHCALATYDFDATDNEGDPYLFELLPGSPGVINEVSGNWWYIPSYEDVGNPQVVEIRAIDNRPEAFGRPGPICSFDLSFTNEAPFFIDGCYGAIEALGGQETYYNVTAIDNDPCDPLKYFIEEVIPPLDPPSSISINQGNGWITLTPEIFPTDMSYEVFVGITDSYDTNWCSVNCIVRVDSDFDGVADIFDNCPNTYSESQVDSDDDGLGNVCDNCIYGANPNQEDLNSNYIGDVCEECPTVPMDMNNSGSVDASDYDALAAYLLWQVYSGIPMGLGEADGYSYPSLSDLIVIADHIFNSGPIGTCPPTFGKFQPNQTSNYKLTYDDVFPAGATSMTMQIRLENTQKIRGMVLPLLVKVDGAAPASMGFGSTIFDTRWGFETQFTDFVDETIYENRYKVMVAKHTVEGWSAGEDKLVDLRISTETASDVPRPITVELTTDGPYIFGFEAVSYPLIIQETSPGNLNGWAPMLEGCGGICDNTNVGTDVSVELSPELEVTFEDVTETGATEFSVNTCTPPSSPPNITVSGDDYYCISTSATFDGLVELCFRFPASDFDLADIPFLEIYHCTVCDGSDWENITDGSPVVANDTVTICGLTDDLSPFALGIQEGCCIGNRGNANNDPGDNINIADITFLVQYLFGIPSGPAPVCAEEANANSDPTETANIADITFLVNYLFGIPNGPAPGACP